MKGFLLYCGLALVTLTLETSFFKGLPGGSWRGPISFLLVLQASYHMRWMPGLIFVILCGWLTEAFGAPSIGALPVCYVLIFFGVRLAKERIYIETPLTWALWAGFFSALTFALWSCWPTVPLQATMMIPRAIYYVALAMTLRPALMWLKEQTTGEGEELALH